MLRNWLCDSQIGLIFLLAAGSLGCSQAPRIDVKSEASEVRAREIAFAATMADRDLDAFVSFISPEAVFFRRDEPLRGRDAILDAWARYFVEEDAPFSWTPDVVEVLDSGRLALSSGPVVDASGEVIGRFNSVWRKDEDSQWRVVFDKGS